MWQGWSLSHQGRRVLLLNATIFFLLLLPHSQRAGGAICTPSPEEPGDNETVASYCLPLYFGAPDPPSACAPRTCLFEGTTYFDSYQCSDQSFDYTMTQTFQDPLPENTQLTNMEVTLFGRFQCDASGPATVMVLTLNNAFLAAGEVVNPTAGCSCPNCATELLVPNSTTGLNSYHYGPGNNTLTLRVLEGQICLSAVQLLLSYSQSPPSVSRVIPQSGLYSGGSLITIIGNSFYPSPELGCNFGLTFVPAVFVNSSIITCQAPTAQADALAYIKVTENNVTFSDPTPYYFYSPFTITSVTGLKGPVKGGTIVHFTGTNFKESDLQLIVCRFGDYDVAAFLSNSTDIQCRSPSLSNTTRSVKVRLYLSQNGLDFNFTDHYFEYVMPNGPTNRHFTAWQWAIFGVICLTMLSFLFGGVIFLRWIVKQRRPTARSKLQPSASDPLLAPDMMMGNYGANSNFPLITSSFNNIDLASISDMKLIEKGSFGLIYKGTWEGSTVAIKKLPSGKMTPAFIEELQQEAAIMRQLRHPNILNFVGTSCDLDGRQICIVMEYMDRGSLYRLIHDEDIQFTLEQMRSICIDAARGINYLHNLNPPIIHRDLKSHNLLINSEGTVKVCDFGLSRFIESTLAGTMTACGTPSWTAPEVLRNERYNSKIDVYSFGIVIWELFARQDPYPGMPPFQIVFAVGSQFARPVINEQWPGAWVRLMTRCWDENPDLRPTFEQILHCLQHKM